MRWGPPGIHLRGMCSTWREAWEGLGGGFGDLCGGAPELVLETILSAGGWGVGQAEALAAGTLPLALGLGGGEGLGGGRVGRGGAGEGPSGAGLPRPCRLLGAGVGKAGARCWVAGLVGAHLESVLGDHVVVDQRVQQREGAVHGHGDLRAVQPQETAQRRVPTGPGLARHCGVGDAGLGAPFPRLGSRGLGVPPDLWGVWAVSASWPWRAPCAAGHLGGHTWPGKREPQALAPASAGLSSRPGFLLYGALLGESKGRSARANQGPGSFLRGRNGNFPVTRVRDGPSHLPAPLCTRQHAAGFSLLFKEASGLNSQNVVPASIPQGPVQMGKSQDRCVHLTWGPVSDTSRGCPGAPAAGRGSTGSLHGAARGQSPWWGVGTAATAAAAVQGPKPGAVGGGTRLMEDLGYD